MRFVTWTNNPDGINLTPLKPEIDGKEVMIVSAGKEFKIYDLVSVSYADSGEVILTIAEKGNE